MDPTAGFSWLAFFFGGAWAFANRGWVLGILFALAELPVELLSQVGRTRGIGLTAAGLLVTITSMYVFGRYGHVWLAWSLKRQGYEEVPGHVV